MRARLCNFRRPTPSVVANVGVCVSIALLAASCSPPPTSVPQPDVSTVDQQTGTDILVIDTVGDASGDAGFDGTSRADVTAPIDADASSPPGDVSADATTTSGDATMSSSDVTPDQSDGGDEMSSCPFPLRVCPDGTCANIADDPNNCGGCGQVCSDAGPLCSYALCGTTCGDSSLIVCNGACTFWATDPQNCGQCGLVCPAGIGCVHGECSGPLSCTQCEINNYDMNSYNHGAELCVGTIPVNDAGVPLSDGGADGGNGWFGCDGFTGTDRDNCIALLELYESSSLRERRRPNTMLVRRSG